MHVCSVIPATTRCVCMGGLLYCYKVGGLLKLLVGNVLVGVEDADD